MYCCIIIFAKGEAMKPGNSSRKRDKRNRKTREATHLRRILLACLTLVLILGGFPGSPYKVYAAGAAKSGEKIYTSDLFYAYPAYLNTQNDDVKKTRTDAENAIHNLSTADEWILKGQTALSEAEDVVIGGIGSLFGLDTDMESKCQQKAAEQLLQELSEDDGLAQQYAEDMKNDQNLLKIGKNGYDWYDFFKEYKKPGVDTDTIKELEDNEELKSLIDEEAISAGMDGVDFIVDAQEAVAMITMLEGIQQEEMQYLIDHVSVELAAPIEKYQTYIRNNYQDYLAKKYIKKYTYDEFVNIKSLIKAVQPEGSGYAAAYSVVKTFCGFIAKAESIFTGLGSASDYVVAEILNRYTMELGEALNDQRTAIITDPVYPETVSEYELGYGIYLTSVCAFADAAKTVNTEYSEMLDADTAKVKAMTVQDHYEDCKARILSVSADERNTKKVDPEKSYAFHYKGGTLTVAEPTDNMEAATIYTGNGLVHYNISLESGDKLTVDANAAMQNISSYMGNVTFTSGKEVTVNNISNAGGTVTNEKNTNLHVLDTMTGCGNNYPTASYSDSYFVNNGNIVIDGELYGDGEYGIYSYNATEYVHLTSGSDATLTVNGDARYVTVSKAGDYYLNGETNLALGSAVEGATATFTVHAPATKNIRLGSLSFATTEEGTSGCDIVYVYDAAKGDYNLKGTGAEYTVSGGDYNSNYMIDSPSSFGKFSVRGTWTLYTTLYADEFTIEGSGLLSVEENALLQTKNKFNMSRADAQIKSAGRVEAGSVSMNGADLTISENAELHVLGDLIPSGNNYPTDGVESRIYNYGRMLVDGNLIGDGEYGTYSYSGSSVTFSYLKEGSYTEVKGDISDHSVTLSGEAVFHGKVGLYSSDITETGKLYVHAPAGAGVSFGKISLTPVDEAASGCELVLVRDPEDSAYEITVEAPDCNMSADSNSKIRRFTGTSAVRDLSLSGEWKVEGTVTGGRLSPGSNNPIRVLSGGRMTVTELSLNGNAYVDEGGELIIKGKAVLNGNNYPTDGRTSALYNAGRLVVEGDIYGDGSYGTYSYSGSSIASLHGQAGSYTEIGGKISDISVSINGDFMFKGEVALTSTMPAASGSIETDTEPGKTVKIGKLIFTPLEGAQTGCKMKMAYDAENKRYNVSFNAPEYDLSTYSRSDPPYYLVDESRIHAMTIAQIWYIENQLHLEGNFTENTYGFVRLTDDAAIDFCGNAVQKVSLGSNDNNTITNLTITNTSEEGIVFETGIKVTRLFDHRQNNFELQAAGTFPDYDGDGYIDSEDYEPTDAKKKGVRLTASTSTSEDGESVITVTRPDGRVLRDKIDYTAELDENSKIIVQGRQIYTNSVLFCEHKNLIHVAAAAPTCTAPGNTEYWQCADCGDAFKDKGMTEAVSAEDVVLVQLAHKPVTGNDAVPATCTEDGRTASVDCSVCGTVIEEGTVIPHSGHTEVTIPGKAASCTEPGYTDSVICEVCKAVLTEAEEIPATGHDFEERTIETCTGATVTTNVCKTCGYTEAEGISADGHEWEEDYRIDLEPTCTSEGSKSIHCKNCDATKDSIGIEKLGHNWSAWSVAKAATTSAEGIETRSCSICRETETRPISKLKPAADTSAADKPKTSVITPDKAKSNNPISQDKTAMIGKKAAAVNTKITSTKSDEIKGSVFQTMKPGWKKVGKTSLTIRWSKMAGATGYVVYGVKCGSKFTKLGTTTKTTFTHNKLKKGTYYKYCIAAIKKDTVMAVSKTIHVSTSGGKTGNVKSVKVNKKKVTLKKGKTFTVKATLKAASSKLKVKNHRKVAFESSDPAVAKVTAKGKITAVKKGTCYIYAYAQDGVSAKVKVTVK